MIDKNSPQANIPVPGRMRRSTAGRSARRPASQNDGLGVSFSGSSTLENQYVLDGATTTTNGRCEVVQVSDQTPIIDGPKPPPLPPPVTTGDAKLAAIAAGLLKDRREIVVEAHGMIGSDAATRARGEAVKAKLIDDGVPAARIHTSLPHVGAPAENGNVRVLRVGPRGRAAAEPAGAARVEFGRKPSSDSARRREQLPQRSAR